MKALLRVVLALTVFLLPVAASAETSIAVLDLQKVMTESKAALNIQAQVQNYREKSQAEIGAIEQKLRDEQQALAAGKESMPPEEFAAKKAAFEQSLGQTRNIVQEKKRVLDEAFSTAVTVVRDRVLEIVAQISEEKGYQLVLTRQNVVLVEKPFDITDQVMEKLNASLTEVPLNVTAR